MKKMLTLTKLNKQTNNAINETTKQEKRKTKKQRQKTLNTAKLNFFF